MGNKDQLDCKSFAFLLAALRATLLPTLMRGEIELPKAEEVPLLCPSCTSAKRKPMR